MAVGRDGSPREAGTTVACGSCGALYGARHVVFIDRARDEALLRRFISEGFAATGTTECPRCGTVHVIEEALTVLDADADRLLVLAPAHRRHRVLQLTASALDLLASQAVDFVTPGLSNPRVLFDVSAWAQALGQGSAPARRGAELPFDEDTDGPRDATARVPALSDSEIASQRATRKLAAARPAGAALAAPTVPEVRAVDAHATASVDLSADSGMASVERLADSAEVSASSSTQVKARQAVAPAGTGASRLLEILSRKPTPEGTSPLGGSTVKGEAPRPPQPRETGWNRALDDGWSTEQPTDAPANEDPTHVVSVEQVTSARPAATQRPRSGPAFDTARADGGHTYLQVDGGRVQAVALVELTRANAFAQGQVSLAFQWHTTPLGPALALLLTRRDGHETVDHVLWWIAPATELGRTVLEALAADFIVDVVLHLDGGAFHARRTIREPLERNVESARTYLREQPSLPDATALRRVVEAADFDLFGRLQHNFHVDSFAEVRTASEARLAVGIVSYWSTPERRDYLLRVKSFPEVWFDQLTRRVASAALEFGIALEPGLRRRAVDSGVAENSTALVRASLANFAEVCLNLKPNELDALDTWDNWAALMALADELDVRVPEDIEALAALAMERARDAAQAGESVDGELADESVELDAGDELAELSTSELAGLLYDTRQRFDAAFALLHRGEAGQASSLFEVMRRMSREQLLRAVPLALAHGPTFEAAFIGGIRSQRVSLRLAAALFLAEIRSERAIPRLIETIPRAGIDEWQFVARAAARLGRKIIPAALQRAALDGDPGERLAFTLALLGPEARGALSAALDRETSERAKTCAHKAIDRAGEVSFGDPADFSERLADAFQACGPDAVGPDFEEELASIEVGPAASAKDLEADVDLDDFEEPRGR